MLETIERLRTVRR